MSPDKIDIRRIPAEREDPRGWNLERDFPQNAFDAALNGLQACAEEENWGDLFEPAGLLKKIDPERFEAHIRPLLPSVTQNEDDESPWDVSLEISDNPLWLKLYIDGIYTKYVLHENKEILEAQVSLIGPNYDWNKFFEWIRAEFGRVTIDYFAKTLQAVDELKFIDNEKFQTLVGDVDIFVQNTWRNFNQMKSEDEVFKYWKVHVAGILKSIDSQAYTKYISKQDAPSARDVRTLLNSALREVKESTSAENLESPLRTIYTAKILLSVGDEIFDLKSEALPATRSY